MEPQKGSNRNWREYNKKLVRNGSIKCYIDKELLDKWYAQQQEGGSQGRGRPKLYSDEAMSFCQIIRFVYKQALRQTQGLVDCILNQLHPGLKAPCYTQMSRRLETLSDSIKSKLSKAGSGETVYIIFDSTGLKVYGEGEWKVRKYGYSKRRTWRKLHICIDAATQEVLACELTENNVDDANMATKMLEEVPSSVEIVGGDGGYDNKSIYNLAQQKGIRTIIPPDKNAVLSRGKYRDENPGLGLRNEVLLEIQKNMLKNGMTHEEAIKEWKIQNNYHQRSKVETAFYRLKTCLGDKLSSRKFSLQKVEAEIKCYILNKLAA